MLRLVLVVVVSWSGLARAQLTLEDDFEKTVLVPTGKWEQAFTAFPSQQTIGVQGPARRAGLQGLRFDDGQAGGNQANNMFVRTDSVPDAGPQYARTWWRATPFATATIQTLVDLNIDSTIASAVEVKWRSAQNELLLVCHDANSGAVLGPVTKVVGGDGGFHLIEAAALGMGTANGTCVMAVDGVEVTRASLDWTGRSHAWTSLGPSPGDLAWTGQMDFDDFAAGTTPRASRMVPETTGPLVEGVCLPVEFGFATSFGGTDVSVFDDVATVTVDGGAAFEDALCGTPIPALGLEIPAGTATFEIFVRPTAQGDVQVSVEPRDVIGTSVVLPVIAASNDAGVVDPPDGGVTGPGHGDFLVGCDCGSAGPTATWLFGVLLALSARRRGG